MKFIGPVQMPMALTSRPLLLYARNVTPAQIIDALRLRPHPEGGHYRETWRHHVESGRGAGTAIYYFLQAGERSRWHRLDATEIWHFYHGAALELSTYAEGQMVQQHVLGPDLLAGQRPQVRVAPHQWQTARSLGGWSLVGCTVSPAFDFDHFELAPERWRP
jgi:predicted cupin superfamily sugar epimerase